MLAAQETTIDKSIPVRIGELANEQKILHTIKAKNSEYLKTGETSLSGLSTGFPQLDDTIDGLQKEHLITVGARTGIGKSWFALNLIKNIAIDQKVPIALFSLEMSITQIMHRLVSLCTGISVTKIRRGMLSEKELNVVADGFDKIRKSPFLLSADMSNRKLSTLRSNMNKIENAELVIIDHIGLMYVNSQQANNRVTEVGEITSSLKEEAKNRNIPILGLAQLNRKAADKDGRPRKSELRESGSIEQD